MKSDALIPTDDGLFSLRAYGCGSKSELQLIRESLATRCVLKGNVVHSVIENYGLCV